MLKERPAEIPAWVLERFPPSPRSAVDFLRPLIDEGMLLEIAEADYAEDTDEHLAALKQIWAGGDLDAWHPLEVLELIRWSEPEDPFWKPGSTGIRGHQMRAFCCAILLATPNEEPNKETLIQLINSVLLIGTAATEATGRFLTSQFERLGLDEDRPFFVLAVVALLQKLDSGMSVSREMELADWILEAEAIEREQRVEFHEDDGTALWLFGLSFSDMRNDQWKALIAKMADASTDRPLGQLFARKHDT